MSFLNNSNTVTDLESLLITQKELIVAELKALHENMLKSFTREALIVEGSENYSGMAVRLNWIDNFWRILSGDSSFDSSHKGFWAYGSLDYDIEPEDLDETIGDLADNLISDLLEDEACSEM